MTAGTYGGGTWGSPLGIGLGLYFDQFGRAYPQLYGGTPGFSLSGGYTPDLEGLLTGTSIAGSAGSGKFRLNGGASGTALGTGFGTPGIGTTYGLGPFEMSRDFSRPWANPSVHDSVAAAGIPSRYNVWEYDYPDSSATPNAPDSPANASVPPQSVFAIGTAPLPYLPPALQNRASGLPGLIAAATGLDPSNPDAAAPGGLPGLLMNYLRSN